MVGPLAHLLKNRFYIGEVAYRGEVHPGEHPPIVDGSLFEAVQERLKEKAITRRTFRTQSPAVLMGLLYDDRGNRMSPSHANKKGVRYRYYVSHALLQGRKAEAGSVSRISAPDVETLVCKSIREAVGVSEEVSGRDLVGQHIERIAIHANEILVRLRSDETATDEPKTGSGTNPPTQLRIPFTPTMPAKKGILHAPSGHQTIDAKSRDALLQAIARSRRWMDAILAGKAASLDDIATPEGLAERHVRRLASLAFLSPKIIQAIADGSAPASLNVSRLTDALPHCWADQEQLLGLS
jgi:hypothetical protein